MLYFIHQFLDINILGYITIRAGIAFFIALTLTLYLMPKFIRWVQRTSSVQPINEWAPDRHQKKISTPTMGGIVFIGATIIATLLTARLDNAYALGGLLTLLLFSCIGFWDDFAKIKKNENLAGFKARTKLLLQIISALIIACFLCYAADFNTDLYVPFLKQPLLDMGAFAIVLWVLVIVATSNAINLTDGLDGVATVPSIVALTTFSIIIYIIGNVKISSYLLMPHFEVSEVAIIASALIGALTGFLWYNCHPAEVFMGDSGSLTIGAFLGYLAIISKSEILLLLIGSIFVIETLSVFYRLEAINSVKNGSF